MGTLLMRAAMLASRARYWRPLETLADTPTRAQSDALARIVTANRATVFGVAHRFRSIDGPDAFRAAVPVQHYESLRDAIETQRRSGEATLTAEAPVFYARTSGSTGSPKLVPVTPTALRFHREEQSLFTYLQYRARPDAFAGRAWGIMGAAVEGRLDSGHAVGSVSGTLYESLPRMLRARFVIPPAVSRIEDYDTKYLVVLRLALASRDITYLGAPNPSTFLRLATLLDTRRDVLARSLESGTIDALGAVDGSIHDAVAPLLRREAERAGAIARMKKASFASLWPDIRLLTTWTGGSCGIALDALRPLLPTDCSVMELGYQATEMRGTLALESETPAGLLPLNHHYFEFVDKDQWDTGDPEFLGIADLVADRRYYVVVTTAAGLYRYFMNDLVEVSGRFGNTPLIRFVQKGKGVTNLTGEKLYEGQVINAVTMAARAAGRQAAFFQMVAHEETSQYRLYFESEPWPGVEPFAVEIDARLGELNIEYSTKRSSGRLGPLRVCVVRSGAADAYKSACLQRGQREGQFKPTVLHYSRDVTWPLEEYVVT